MKNRNQKSDSLDMFDVAIKDAATRAFDEYNKSLDISDEEVDFSEEHKKNMEKLFADYRRKERARKIRRISSRAACVVAALSIVSATAMIGAGAWRLKLMNFIFDPKAPGTEINFNDNGGTTYSDEYVRLNYVPFGFKMTEQSKNSQCDMLAFEYGEKYFTVIMGTIDSQPNIDTENVVFENVTVNGYEGVFTSKKNGNLLLWHDDYNMFIINGNISEEEIMKIAKCIQVLENFG